MLATLHKNAALLTYLNGSVNPLFAIDIIEYSYSTLDDPVSINIFET
jgi:hypothetical protein